MGHAALTARHLPSPSLHVGAEAWAVLAGCLLALAVFALSADTRSEPGHVPAYGAVRPIGVPAPDAYGMAARPTRDTAVKLVGICAAARAADGARQAQAGETITVLAAGLPSTMAAWRADAADIRTAAAAADPTALGDAFQKLVAECSRRGY
ncbi:MAG: hypothetical protein ACTHOG_03995 [Marmoricola sp.]